MAITFNPAADFANEIRAFIIGNEGPGETVYNDIVSHVPTVGYGYALIENKGSENNYR